MKTILDQDLIKSFTIDRKPTLIEGKKVKKVVESVPNPNRTAYIIFDDHRDAPRGFGVRVAPAKTTYIVQKKIRGRVIKTTVGDLSLYTLAEAREEAGVLVKEMKDTGQNPSFLKKQKEKEGVTLGQCFENYLYYLENDRNPKASENTTIQLKKSRAKLSYWENTRVNELDLDKIKKKFRELYDITPMTAEITFRWATIAVNNEIEGEEQRAQQARRDPFISFNPFKILKGMYRTKKQLNEQIKASGKRLPLLMKDGSLGKFLDALWARRKENRTGSDYILCCLLWGIRKNEAADLQWRDLLTNDEATKCSWVDLEARKVFFYDTKARVNHELPLCDAAYGILRQRKEINVEMMSKMITKQNKKKGRWVFPARSPFSKTGHYTDGRSLLGYVCEDAGIKRRGFHDFRRSFATVAEALCSHYMVKHLLGHASVDVTAIYPDFILSVPENLQKIEAHLLAPSPTVYNALLPTHKPLLTDIKI